MDRISFLRNLGLAGVGLTLPGGLTMAHTDKKNAVKSDCVLIPSETKGPFPLDLTENSTFMRQDVREDRKGVLLKLKLKIIGQDNCEPMSNVRVNIWHCDKDGLYSGYDNNMNPGQSGLTYLRGWQTTDANGEVEFTTIFPGWYNGRICHIHFQVHVSSSYSAVSQLTFPIDTKNSLYANNSSLYTKGSDPLTYSQDNIFSDGYQYQIADLTANSSTGGYDSYLEVTVQGSGTLGLGNIEKENAKNFSLGQNYPNPFTDQTVIPFELAEKSKVEISLFDINGQEVIKLDPGTYSRGKHELKLDFKNIGLASQNYLYQIKVTNSKGVYIDNKMMTAK